MNRPLDFGVFVTPFHSTGQSPTRALEYDMERVVALDRLGFDEAWFGEHHSGGYELIACPEVFIAAAAERTKHIRLAAKGNCCIGTTDDAIAYIEDLLARSGGFGASLLLGHDWASPEATFHSYDLFARKVIPHFKGQLEASRASHEWAKGKRDQLLGRAGQAVVNAITQHTGELKPERSN
jgi:alkanesulfonate monooxygenase SsuD/methylene tetrahydromethanopterin reductase-like flavin-dependent oxidoreductase (luciferase family)